MKGESKFIVVSYSLLNLVGLLKVEVYWRCEDNLTLRVMLHPQAPPNKVMYLVCLFCISAIIKNWIILYNATQRFDWLSGHGINMRY